MSNRISHFFFANNTPTGVNYTSPILSSVVYHDGAEYPYLPGLPFYNGQALDNLPNLGFVGDCTNRFERAAVGHEQNLIEINERFFTALDDFNFGIIELILQWVFEVSLSLGVGGLLIAVFNWLTGTLGLTTPPPQAVTDGLNNLENHWSIGDGASPTNPNQVAILKAYEEAKLTQQAMVQQAITTYNEAYRIVSNSGGVYGSTFRDNPVIASSQSRARLTELRNILFNLTGYADWQPGRIFSAESLLGKNTQKLNLLYESAKLINNIRLVAFQRYVEDAKAWLKGAKELGQKSFAVKLILGLPALLKSVLLVILRVLTPVAWVAMVGFVLYATYELIDGISALCSKTQDTLTKLKLQQQTSMEAYYSGIESLLQEGCCDIKPCDPCPNGTINCPDAEGNCAPCGSGSGSNTLGVGLQLLIDTDAGSITKYIPVSVVSGADAVDHVPTCGFAPRRNGVYCPPTPSCPSMKPLLRFGELYQKYIDKQGRPFPMDKDWFRGITTTHPPGVDIPNPRTACNWLDLDADLGPSCNTLAPLYNEFKSLLSTTFGSGESRVPTILEAIDTARLSRGLD